MMNGDDYVCYDDDDDDDDDDDVFLLIIIISTTLMIHGSYADRDGVDGADGDGNSIGDYYDELLL